MYIRDAVLSDLNTMVRLLKQLFAIEADFKFDSKKHKMALREIIKDIHCGCKIAENELGQVIGMCTAQWVYSTATGNKSAWIEDLVVDQDHRGQKTGQNLLESVTQWCLKEGCDRLQLVYDLDNQPAIDFYKKNQFNTTRLGIFSKRLST